MGAVLQVLQLTLADIVGTFEEDIDKFDNLKIIESGNKMTEDRHLNNVEGMLSFPAIPLILCLSIIVLTSVR